MHIFGSQAVLYSVAYMLTGHSGPLSHPIRTQYAARLPSRFPMECRPSVGALKLDRLNNI